MKRYTKNGKLVRVATNYRFQQLKTDIVKRKIIVKQLTEERVGVYNTARKRNTVLNQQTVGGKVVRATVREFASLYYAKYYDCQIGKLNEIVLTSQQAQVVCSIQRPTPIVVPLDSGGKKNSGGGNR